MSKIGIIGAMDLEVNALKEAMQLETKITRANMDFYEGTLNGANVVIVRCGIGKVNAALCTQILADCFCVTHIINTGVAGSLNAKLDIGDIVISRDAIHHDVDVTIFGYALGEVPQIGVREFAADKTMAELALKTCRKVNPDIHAIMGRVVSGDQFISDKNKKKWLIENFNGFCCEMEGAAIAQAAYLNEIPFLIVRAISDKADDSASVDYPEFEAKAIIHSVNLILEMAQQL